MSKKQNILLISATKEEVVLILQKYAVISIGENVFFYETPRFFVHHLISGVGIGVSAHRITRQLSLESYDFACQVGLGGSFTREFTIGDCVEVEADLFGEMIQESGEAWHNLSDGFFNNKFIKAPHCSISRPCFPKAIGVTVNMVSTNDHLHQLRKSIFNAEVESMEGASFFLCCQELNIAGFQWRCISNYTGDREKGQWDIPYAIGELNQHVIQFLENEN